MWCKDCGAHSCCSEKTDHIITETNRKIIHQ
jgi:hypothetical protein